MNFLPKTKDNYLEPFDFREYLEAFEAVKRERRLAAIPPGQLLKTNPELFTPIRKKRK